MQGINIMNGTYLLIYKPLQIDKRGLCIRCFQMLRSIKITGKKFSQKVEWEGCATYKFQIKHPLPTPIVITHLKV